MYAPFFGLKHPPFSIAPDPRYLFMSERHREALAHLLYGLDAGGGFVLLTGEVGTGKTTVCRCFLEQIPSHCNVAYIFNPKLTVGELLRSICDEFGVPHKPAVPGMETVKDCIDPLNASLLAAHASGRNNVLIIDEAQNLSADVLEQLRLLTNLETSERKLLQIILIGQPELRTMVARPSMEQLAQRVIARFHLDALTPLETQQYIAHRLAVAGLTGPLPFSHRALRRVHVLARGVPRRINLLCDRALLGAYAAGEREVSVAIVERAAREVFDARAAAAARRQISEHGLREGRSTQDARLGAGRTRSRAKWPRWAVAAAGVAVGAASVAVAGWALGRWQAGPPRAVAAVAAPAPAPAAARPAVVPPAAPSTGAAPAVASGPPATPVPPATGASAATGAAGAGLPPAGAATAVKPLAPATGLSQFMAALPASDAPAWKALAAAWGASLADGADACVALPREGLRCYRNRRAGLNLVRQIDRPVVLTLYPSEETDDAVWAVLRALDADTATLEGGGMRLQVPVQELAHAWRGEIATLWRAPPGMPERGDILDSAAGTAWLDQQLATKAAGGAGQVGKAPTPAARQSHIQRFQLAQGATPDGRAGPLTLMLLNRAVGVSEPRLRTGG